MSDLGQKWMTGWCWALGLFGAMLLGGASEVTSRPIHLLFDLLNEPGKLVFNPHLRFSLAVLEAVTIGSTLSIAARSWLNAVLNTIFVAAFLVPVLRSDVLSA